MSAAETEISPEQKRAETASANHQSAIYLGLQRATETVSRRVLDCFQKLDPEGWTRANSDYQANTTAEVVTAVREALVDGFRALLEADHPVATGGVESVTFKDGDIKAVLKIPPGDRTRHQLADRTGATVLIAMIDMGSYADSLSRLHDEYVDAQDQGRLWGEDGDETDD